MDSITNVNRDIKLEVYPGCLLFHPNYDDQAANDSRINLFKVTVTNQSQVFTDFQAELSAPGIPEDSELQWYKMDSRLGSDIPPDESTTFEIQILKVPLPGERQIAIDLTVSSLKYKKLKCSVRLFLEVQPPNQALKIQLVRKNLQIFPKEAFEIPFVLTNISSKGLRDICVTLSCTTFPPESWCEQKDPIEYLPPGATWSDSFRCKIDKQLEELKPEELKPFHYFTVDATPARKSSHFAYDEGKLKILTLYGVLSISCTQPKQLLRSGLARYVFDEVQNLSSSPQRVNISVSDIDGKVHRLDNCLDLKPSEKLSEVEFKIQRSQRWRDWIGLKKTVFLQAAVEVIDPSSGERSQTVQPKPGCISLELIISPKIPLLLQILCLLIPVIAGIPISRFNNSCLKEPVNAVRFNGSSNTIFSVSASGTVCRWEFDQNKTITSVQKLPSDKATSEVLAIRPKDNNQLAIGFSNGKIQIQDTRDFDKSELPSESKNKVFALAFTKTNHLLFAGYADNNVYGWSLDDSKSKPLYRKNVKFPILAIAINEDNQSTLIFLGGRSNQLSIWNPKLDSNPTPIVFPAQLQVIGQQHYITSLATARDKLIVGDNSGSIGVCKIETTNAKNPCRFNKEDIQDLESPVRSLGLTDNGNFVVSRDDSSIKLWKVSGTSLQPLQSQVNQQDINIKSVDITTRGNKVFIASNTQCNFTSLSLDRLLSDLSGIKVCERVSVDVYSGE